MERSGTVAVVEEEKKVEEEEENLDENKIDLWEWTALWGLYLEGGLERGWSS